MTHPVNIEDFGGWVVFKQSDPPTHPPPMAAKVPNYIRDALVMKFRERLMEKMSIVPFPHQRSWFCASEGSVLLTDIEDPSGASVRLPDGTATRWMTAPREGGPARTIADLGAYKVGKSYGAALWATGFAAVPDAKVSLVGLEYDICVPEFDYLCEFLLSERGMNLPYATWVNRPRDGKMWLDLPNGARYDARSWERKDSLKGKEIDAYVFCEAYMLPGIECYTSNSQNLRARAGFAIFPTTPDRPWVEELHRNSHSGDPEFADWHCTCGVDASVNPHTYNAAQRERDKKLMTREKYAIHYEGKLGDYVGRVYNFQRGQELFSIGTMPQLFKKDSEGKQEDVVIPAGWELVGSVDTGTYYTGVLVVFSPDGDAYVLAEFPNYNYIAGSPQRDEGVTIPRWSLELCKETHRLGGRANYWADKNSQFKRELISYGVNLLPSKLPLEARTEITREYLQHGKLHLAPWLEILPFEIENAQWPPEHTSAGKFARMKDRDHTLDCLEHILSQRPRGKVIGRVNESKTWIENYLGRAPRKKRHYPDPHLGRD